jgi:flagellar assembly factor FliW
MTDTTTTDMPPGLRFPEGIPGLSAATDFVLESLTPPGEDALFDILRSGDDSVSLIVTQPWTFFPDYAPDLPDDQLESIGITTPEDLTIFCAVTLDQEEGCVWVNLMAPFVVHVTSRLARQIVLTDSDWPLRARVDIHGESD